MELVERTYVLRKVKLRRLNIKSKLPT